MTGGGVSPRAFSVAAWSGSPWAAPWRRTALALALPAAAALPAPQTDANVGGLSSVTSVPRMALALPTAS